MRTSLHIVKSAQLECTGMYRIVAGLARHAPLHGYRVRALFLEDGPLRARLQSEGIQADVAAWNGTRTDALGLARVALWLRRHPADIAHLHHGGGILRTLCRWSGARAVVQHVHSEAPELESSSPVRHSFRGADAVIACSRAAADALRSFQPHLIYAGIRCPEQLPAPASSGPLRLGVLARLIPLKRIETVIEATARLVEQHIEIETEICGTGPELDRLRALAAARGVSSHVRFLGWREDTAQLLASWHALALTSTTEGFPISVLEAMAAGRAVVASRVGGLPELVEDNLTGRLIPPADPDALTACLAELTQNRTTLTQMGINGWQRVRTHFSEEAMTAQVTALYDRLLSR